jgi:phosphoglycerol transferase MdoB-like AlkP superfamily enzyme
MRWADEGVGAFLERLDFGGLASRTVVLVFGDHEAGLRRITEGPYRRVLGRNLGERIVNDRVPVVIWIPGEHGPRGAISMPTGLINLPPTLAAVLGVDPANLPWIGRNVFGSPGEGRVTAGYRAR